MEVFLRTRGFSFDYRFLGEAPGEFWWRSYLPVTDIERPTILVESDRKSWRCYIAGIGSERRDKSGNTVQFDLALAGDCGPPGLALDIIATTLAELAKHPGRLIPDSRLDGQLAEADVERMLDSPGAGTAAEIAEAVQAAYRGGPAAQLEPPEQEVKPGLGRWLGGLGHAESRNKFITLIARLLAGHQAGRALLLSLVASDDDTQRIPDPDRDGDLGVLTSRSGPLFQSEVRHLAGKAPSSDATNPPETASRPDLARKAIFVAVGAVILAAVITWIIFEHKTRH
jgi:hypothetical protein